MKILVVSELLPSRAGGGTSRHFNLIRELANKHEVHIITRASQEDTNFLPELEEYSKDITIIQAPKPLIPKHSRMFWLLNAWVHALFDLNPLRGRDFDNIEFRRAVKQKIQDEHYDIIQIHQAYMATGIKKTHALLALDMHDILSEYEHRLINNHNKGTRRLLAWLEWKKMLNFERNTIRRFDICLTVSEHDRNLLQNIHGNTKVYVIPNGVDTDYYQPQPADTTTENENIIFTGSMGYQPNADGVLWFHSEIFPLVKSKAKNVHLFIVGRGANEEIIELGKDPQVTVTGFVDDIRPYVKQSAVFIVPLRYGSGTRLKILDAWAMSKAIVSTSLGAEGLAYHARENILIADSPQEFSGNILELFANPELRSRLGQSGRKLAENQYSWRIIGDKLHGIYQDHVRY